MLQFDEVQDLRARHPAWLLLKADNAPLILSFVSRVFVEGGEANLPAERLISLLDDELFALRQRLGSDKYPRTARDYLVEWSTPEKGWLRRYYPPGSDEPHYDVTPAVEKAIAWVADLRARSFIGTESRLSTIVELLRQLVYGSTDDPTEQLDDLRRRRAQIDAEIERLEAGGPAMADPVTQRDRYQQFARTARELLSDFRQVEENFRELDRDLRRKIAGWDGSKGDLLDDVVANRAGISESDQGRSFRAFYDLLLSHDRRAELADLLQRLDVVADIPEFDERLQRVQGDWLDASERTQATVRQLSEQLRRFLDDQVWLENRRIFEILRSIESNAMAVRNDSHVPVEMTMDATSVSITLPLERPLYRKVRSTPLRNATIDVGVGEVDAEVLHDQAYVDSLELARRVISTLGAGDDTTLSTVVAGTPLTQGLAELVGYLHLNDSGLDVDVDPDTATEVTWESDADAESSDGTAIVRTATLPDVRYSRERSSA